MKLINFLTAISICWIALTGCNKYFIPEEQLQPPMETKKKLKKESGIALVAKRYPSVKLLAHNLKPFHQSVFPADETLHIF